MTEAELESSAVRLKTDFEETDVHIIVKMSKFASNHTERI